MSSVYCLSFFSIRRIKKKRKKSETRSTCGARRDRRGPEEEPVPEGPPIGPPEGGPHVGHEGVQQQGSDVRAIGGITGETNLIWYAKPERG